MNEIRELQQLFATAMAQLRAGQIMSMVGVDERISNVCQAAQKAPTEEQQVYLPELTVLINLLNGYEQDLRKLQASLATVSSQGDDDGATD